MTYTERTAKDVATEALRRLNVIPGDQEPEAWAGAQAAQRWQEKWAELVDEGIIEFDFDAVPIDAFRAVVQLTADMVAPNYGRMPDAAPDEPAGQTHPAIDRLRRRAQIDDDGDVIGIEEF